MGFNYAKGKQMFVNDPRVYSTANGNRVPIHPPNAMHRLTVLPTDPVANIVDMISQYADMSGGKLDVLHLLGHGMPGEVQFGREGLDRKNARLFRPLRDKVKVVVLISCSAGGDISPGQINVPGWSLGGGIAEHTNAKVIVCRDIQYVYPKGSFTGRGGVAYSDNGFEGDIVICYPNGGTNYVYKDSKSGLAQIDLEKYIFGQG